MPNLLNSFGRIKTYVNNNGYVVFDSTTAGTYSINLGAGIYNVILIGGGGGGAYCHFGSGHSIIETWAQGGVAGTIDCVIRVEKDVTATLVLGAGGKTNTLISSQGDVSGLDGADSRLSGIPQVSLVAGHSTGGVIVNGYSTTPGTMGSNIISGSEILKINMDSNEHPIVSGSVRGPARNTNYSPNVFYGRGGGTTAGITPTIYEGGIPYCHIEKIETDLYNL